MIGMEVSQDKRLLPVINQQIRIDDSDEASSGYSSRGSHNEDVPYEQRRAADRRDIRRPQWSSKDSLTNIKRDCNNTRSRQADIPKEVSSRGVQTDFEACSCTCGHGAQSVVKSGESISASVDDEKLKLNEDHYDHNIKFSNIDTRREKNQDNTTCNSETQTVNFDLHLNKSGLKLIELLKDSNRQLEEELKATGNFFGKLVKDLESQLLKAELQVGLLKEHLRHIEASKLKFSRCGTHGCNSEEFGKELKTKTDFDGKGRPQTPPKTPRHLESFELRKPRSVDSLLSTSKTSLLKGKDPARIKQTLLERNKALRKEIEMLKTSSIRRTSSGTCLSSEGQTTKRQYSSRSAIDQFDLVMEQVVSQSHKDQKNTDLMGNGNTKWKQTPKSSHGRKKSSVATGPGPSAFRTINVKSWSRTGNQS